MRPKTAHAKSAGLIFITVPALLLATACTSDDGKSSGDQKSSAGSTRTPAGSAAGSDSAEGDSGTDGKKDDAAGKGDASKPLSRPQLERAALASGDLPDFQVSSGEDALAPGGQPVADKAQCQPLADAMGDAPAKGARNTVNRGIGSVKSLGLAVSASVSSYSDADAAELMDALESAVGACGKGFSATLKGSSGSYREVKDASFTTRGADETVSWTTVGTNQGAATPIHLVVARKGATVARFMALDLSRRKPPRVPQELADKQLAKLSRAVTG